MASEDRPRQGLLVDYGGVLTSSPFESFRGFCEREGLEPDELGRRLRSDPSARELVIGLELGTISEEEFEPRFAALLGVAAEGLIDRLFAGYVPDEAMLSAVQRARATGIRTGLISNSWGTRRYDRSRLRDCFDAIVISGEVGMRKPGAEIYALGVERVGLDSEQCVFVDDLSANLDPAAKLGMAAIHHITAEQTIAELESLLGVSLR